MLRVSKDNRKGDVHKIPLTNRQINKINKAKNGMILSLSSTQVKFLEKSGGLVPLLAALLPLIFGGLGAAGAVAGGISSAVSSARNASNAAAQLAETERHNRAIESQLKKWQRNYF